MSTANSLALEALDMIKNKDQAHWSDAHDRVVIAALRAALEAEAAPVAGFTGISEECDFSTDRWTFVMDPGYSVGAGQYMITKIKKVPA